MHPRMETCDDAPPHGDVRRTPAWAHSTWRYANGIKLSNYPPPFDRYPNGLCVSHALLDHVDELADLRVGPLRRLTKGAVQ